METTSPEALAPPPPAWRWVVGYLLVSCAWGLTTPFMRRAALVADDKQAPSPPSFSDDKPRWMQRKALAVTHAGLDWLRSPTYALLLLFNITGSVWFFVLLGNAELSLTVPVVNSMAFLFTVLGEWLAEGKIISRDTWIGMALVLGGIALCVHSKR